MNRLRLTDLDTGDPLVQDQLARYLNGMIGLGVAGFRVDASKHAQEEHVEAVFSQLDDVPGFGGEPHVYHEVYGDETVPYTDYGQVTNFDYMRDIAGSFSDGQVSATVPADGALALHVGGVCDDPEECGNGGDPVDPEQITAVVEAELGEEVHVVGSTSALGSWDPQSGVALITDDDTYPEWSGTVTIDDDAEWKLVKVDGDGNEEWEPGENRVGPATAVNWGDT